MDSAVAMGLLGTLNPRLTALSFQPFEIRNGPNEVLSEKVERNYAFYSIQMLHN